MDISFAVGPPSKEEIGTAPPPLLLGGRWGKDDVKELRGGKSIPVYPT
jgi:hypothetical protein